ncbi:MAG: hypothetical protein IT176_04425 [Acidobacteria bacterium]|nr:hypothetical protein [Acidobacteriota bacterium]
MKPAVLLPLLLLALPASTQNRRVERAGQELPIPITLPLIASNLDTLGGRYVRVLDLRVERFVSPQAFVVGTADHDGTRALVLLRHPAGSALVEGVAVQVLGRAYTLAGASAYEGWPPQLTRRAVAAFSGVPVIVADAVRAPGGVSLY